MILLSDEEIEVVKKYANNPPVVDGMLTFHIYDEQRAIAKAQLKKVGEWGDGDCNEHPYAAYPTGTRFLQRKDCPDCWQSLLKETE